MNSAEIRSFTLDEMGANGASCIAEIDCLHMFLKMSQIEGGSFGVRATIQPGLRVRDRTGRKLLPQYSCCACAIEACRPGESQNCKDDQQQHALSAATSEVKIPRNTSKSPVATTADRDISPWSSICHGDRRRGDERQKGAQVSLQMRVRAWVSTVSDWPKLLHECVTNRWRPMPWSANNIDEEQDRVLMMLLDLRMVTSGREAIEHSTFNARERVETLSRDRSCSKFSKFKDRPELSRES